MPDKTGVIVANPAFISASIQAQVDRVLAEIPEGKHGALVGVATEAGVNLAVAHRVADEWVVAVWLGKDWHGPVAGGAYVKKTW